MRSFLEDLTVFILSAGEETAAECEKSLGEQGCSFEIKHIVNTYPMSRAFQRMPDECDTKYFIQVDSDMILKPHAVRTLYKGIQSASFITYMAHGQLFEEGFGVGGAIRIWKKMLFNFFSFRDCRTVDRDLYRRIKWLPIRSMNLNEVLGLHKARHSPFSNYLKSKSDIEKWRFLGRAPELYAMNRLDESIKGLPGSTSELFGALLGALTFKQRLVRSKDIKLETERFNDIFTSLNIRAVPDLEGMDLDTNRLSGAFASAYKDINNDNSDAKKRLAEIVISIFSRDQDVSADDLLRIAER